MRRTASRDFIIMCFYQHVTDGVSVVGKVVTRLDTFFNNSVNMKLFMNVHVLAFGSQM